MPQLPAIKYPLLYKPFISIGYTNTSTNIATEYCEILLECLPFRRNTDYNRNGLRQNDNIKHRNVYFSRLTTIWIGVALGYAYTPAYPVLEIMPQLRRWMEK